MQPLILIVEDEEAIATLLRYNLEREGFKVAVARDGEEGLAALAEHRPDLAIVDWMLPYVSGLELCRQIRRRPETHGLPVIMLKRPTLPEVESAETVDEVLTWLDHALTFSTTRGV